MARTLMKHRVGGRFSGLVCVGYKGRGGEGEQPAAPKVGAGERSLAGSGSRDRSYFLEHRVCLRLVTVYADGLDGL